ncbi:type II toxin-antitoxin system death-on-curing family toxin [Aliiroseovarius lamellibrachiae]|uniref:type II toxin-antitoxin system death-on-curing family toxin n=1 Tax=Aliiroseovarius lamellibrachiae TaxID=1924933 RepID=UPI001BE0418F|nr:type II toxin-antitoxin system death-on-curing family toxin [Aliiroseovarius lamellibrachiae]
MSIARRHYRLTLADAFIAHDEALSYGGRHGVTSLHLIESAISRPYSGYHRPISRKAAALLESVVGNHGFTDGNKRTAWILVELLIERSGFYLDIPDDEPIDDLVVAVASGGMGFDELHKWFHERIERHK